MNVENITFFFLLSYYRLLFTSTYLFVIPLANSEYYKLLMRNGQDERREATVCSLEELERVTSEHTLKNTVMNCTNTTIDALFFPTVHQVYDTNVYRELSLVALQLTRNSYLIKY